MATCQEQPALFHFQIMLNCRCIYGGSCPPSALLGTAKTLARWIAQFNQHGCPPRGLVTGSAVSSITFAASPARAAIISRIWRAASICSSVGGREPGSGDAGTSAPGRRVTQNPTGVQPQKGEEQLDQDASSATPTLAPEPSCDAHVDLTAFASGPRSELWP
jgi:hypothetical protein